MVEGLPMKKTNIKMIAIAVLCWCFVAPAQAEVGEIYTFVGGKQVDNDAIFTKYMADVIRAVDSYGLAQVKASLIVSGASSPEADYGYLIYIPQHFSIEGDWGTVHDKTIIDLISVFAHEYGHLVFGRMLEKEIPRFAEIRKIGDRISALEIEKIHADSTQVAALTQQIKETYDLIYKNPELIRISQIVSPYNEFFADMIAVYETQSQSAISSALFYPGMDRNVMAYTEARDFGQARDVDTWNQTEEHVLFSPLRSAVGSAKCWTISLEAQKLKLRQMGAILIADIKQKYATNTKPEIADNKALIAAFEKTCR
jgi:hypothetical protein